MGKALRISGDAEGRCAAVVKSGMVYAVSTDPENSDGIVPQVRGALEELQRILKEAGSGKDKILQATVYLSDIKEKPALDSVWVPWIGAEENWPQRACVGVALGRDSLVEVVVTAECE
jgi:enamine deaminase RidA (YjgF/YER057c/UK114 family)